MSGGSRPAFVHADVGRGLLASKRAGWPVDATALQASLLAFVAAKTGAGDDGILLPGFNYDFGRTRKFDVDRDPVQVGALPEWARTSGAYTRSEVPFFSFLSKGSMNIEDGLDLNPFGEKSGFAWLVATDATLVLFGTSLNSLTFIHHVEEMSGGPAYRYAKPFAGSILRAGEERTCNLTMHVRPMGAHLEYDWPRLEADLVNQGIMVATEGAPGMWTISARRILEYWGNQITQDPFYLVDRESRAHFDKITEGGRRRVRIEEFENAG